MSIRSLVPLLGIALIAAIAVWFPESVAHRPLYLALLAVAAGFQIWGHAMAAKLMKKDEDIIIEPDTDLDDLIFARPMSLHEIGWRTRGLGLVYLAAAAIVVGIAAVPVEFAILALIVKLGLVVNAAHDVVAARGTRLQFARRCADAGALAAVGDLYEVNPFHGFEASVRAGSYTIYSPVGMPNVVVRTPDGDIDPSAPIAVAKDAPRRTFLLTEG